MGLLSLGKVMMLHTQHQEAEMSSQESRRQTACSQKNMSNVAKRHQFPDCLLLGFISIPIADVR